MKKLLLATLVAFVSVLNIQAQGNRTIETHECQASRITVEGPTLICKGYGHLIFPEIDYSDYSGIAFEARNFEKLDENVTNAVCSLKIEFTQDGETVKATMGFYSTGKKKVDFKSFKDEKKGIINIDPASITEISIGMGKNKKVDISNITLIAKQ